MPIRDSKRRFGAEYSACGLYRYSLWRAWSGNGGAGGSILWVMLNPSKADHLGTNDPTIERCERRSFLWGFQRMDVVNLFALSATYPAALRSAADPIGPSNDAKIMERAGTAALILCGWGAHGNLGGRADFVRRLLADRPLYCLGTTQSGEPAHPLYLPYDRAPVPYGRL